MRFLDPATATESLCRSTRLRRDPGPCPRRPSPAARPAMVSDRLSRRQRVDDGRLRAEQHRCLVEARQPAPCPGVRVHEHLLPWSDIAFPKSVDENRKQFPLAGRAPAVPDLSNGKPLPAPFYSLKFPSSCTHYLRDRVGSKTTSRASPRRLKQTIASYGHARESGTPPLVQDISAAICHHGAPSGIGACAPSPRKPSPDTNRIAYPISIVDLINQRAGHVAKDMAKSTLRSGTPTARALSTKGRALRANTWPCAQGTREPGHHTSDDATMALNKPDPSAAATARASNIAGNPRKMSVTRMMTESVLPPDPADQPQGNPNQSARRAQ